LWTKASELSSHKTIARSNASMASSEECGTRTTHHPPTSGTDLSGNDLSGNDLSGNDHRGQLGPAWPVIVRPRVHLERLRWAVAHAGCGTPDAVRRDSPVPCHAGPVPCRACAVPYLASATPYRVSAVPASAMSCRLRNTGCGGMSALRRARSQPASSPAGSEHMHRRCRSISAY
jgi:hypothetical protein